MSNRRAILVLVALTILAGVLNVFFLMKGNSLAMVRPSSLLDDTMRPSRVVISSAGAERLALERLSDGWRLVRPYASSANDATVDRLLDAVTFASISETLTEGDLLRRGRTPSDYGIDDSSLRLTIGDASREQSFVFGCMTPSTQEVYVVKEGLSSLCTVSVSVREAVDLPPEAFRRRTIFPYGPESVSSFVLKRPGMPVLDGVRAGTEWRSKDGVLPADRVKKILAALANAQAAEFVWPAQGTNASAVASTPLLAGYGLDSEAGIGLTLRCTDGAEKTFTFGSEAGGGSVFLMTDAGREIVTVAAALKDALTRDETPSARTHVFTQTEADVTSFSMTEGATTLVLTRTVEGAWRMESPIVAQADAAVVAEILGRILALTPADLAEQGVSVSVNTNMQPVVVSASLLMGSRRFEELRACEILRQDPALVRRLVRKLDGQPPTAVVYSRERRAWNVETSARQGAADDAAITRVLAALQPLRAVSVVQLKVSENDLHAYGLDRPFATVAIDQEKASAVRRNVLIGLETAGGRFATVGSSDAIFILSSETVKVLLGEWVGE